MDDSPTCSVCFPYCDQENDDRSQLTWPCGCDDYSKEEGNSSDGIQILDGSHSSQIYQPSSSSRRDQSLVDTVPLMENQQQELIDLKLQIAKQKEELDILSLRLSQYEVENEAIKAEKTCLIDELALSTNAIEERSVSPATRRFSRRGFGTEPNANAGGSMQMLLDKNARLMTDNSRLQVSVTGMQKSFQSYIKVCLRSSRANKETIETLQQENEVMRQQLDLSEGKPKLSESRDTIDTNLESDDATDENQDNMNTHIDSPPSLMKQDMKVNSSHSTPKHENKLVIADDNCTIEGEDIESDGKIAEGTKVEKKNKEVVEEATPNKRSGELLVDFGESRRSRSMARRWHSLTA